VALDDLNISLEGNQLAIVCGPVGSGKVRFENSASYSQFFTEHLSNNCLDFVSTCANWGIAN
jgi:hypothetical protein